jgi:transcriptional regulator with XRE-family HTH domain
MADIISIPFPVRKALSKLGQDIKDARRKRRIPTQLMAERTSMSRATLNKIEKGDPAVAIVHYVKVLFVLGLLERLSDLADVRFDTVGQHLDQDNLPQRIHLPKKQDWEES